ncbi:Hypp7863 [Branchiostoma lanceolatum]|uniref:Hypp7863 protein n=1 Tax=Branchiostoma lanceolatum TaxID=7740 RepID=A0A8K0EBU2_BRALA|nr:Hypp7863 [Branchiostoma lanceolatum]
MEKFENKALSTFNGPLPANWFRYVDDTWCRLKERVADDFFDHINQVDDNIKFTQESCQNNRLPFLDTKTIIEKDGNLEVYRKPTHTDQYLAFDFHHPLEHKLAVIKTLFHRADNVITSDEAKTDEQTSPCGLSQRQPIHWSGISLFLPMKKKNQKDDSVSQQLDLEFPARRKFAANISQPTARSSKSKGSVMEEIKKNKKRAAFIVEKWPSKSAEPLVYVVLHGKPVAVCGSVLEGFASLIWALYCFHQPHPASIPPAIVCVEHHLLKDSNVNPKDMEATIFTTA